MLKNISKYIVTVCLTLTCFYVKAQNDTLSDQTQQDLLNGAGWITEPKDRIVALNELLNSGRITKEGYIAGIYQKLAETKAELYENRFSDCDVDDSLSQECKDAVKEIMDLYDKAMKTCEFCSPSHLLSKYEFEERYTFLEKKAEEDFSTLKSFGYKKDRVGIPIGITYIKTPRADYIGIEISPAGFIAPRYVIKNYNKKTGNMEVVESNPVPAAYQTMTFGFNKNVTKENGHEVWFSMGQITSPVFMNPLKFGFTENYVTDEKVHWFYRPEMGLGWGALSVSCAYNFVFKKQFRREDNKWFLTFRLSYPIIKAYD